ncbi:MAG: 50S ribosomal protein L6 [Euryarchaeota archaeon]|nr:50S ribosomal protein L6 [Euryarchaeota archaeon]
MRIAMVKEEVPVMKGTTVTLKDNVLSVRGPRGSVSRRFFHPSLRMAVSGERIVVEARYVSRREKALVGTWAAHARNMMRGQLEPFEYRMKAVYAHFPIKMAVKGQELVIENFLGEHHPRRAKILGDTKVTVKGQELELSGPVLEMVGQTAANIENATRVKDRDPRVFQDGIFITHKGKGV